MIQSDNDSLLNGAMTQSLNDSIRKEGKTMPYDLLLKGGEVIDPGWPFRGKADVAISKGKIAAVTGDIAATEAAKVIDVNGKIVCPGLIDIHAHTFINAHDMGDETDQRCAASGVTTLVDAGSSGSATFPGLRRYV